MNQPKLKTVKLTTQELNAIVTLLEGVKIEIKEGLWLYRMYEKVLNAFKQAAEADPEWSEVEVETNVNEVPVAENG